VDVTDVEACTKSAEFELRVGRSKTKYSTQHRAFVLSSLKRMVALARKQEGQLFQAKKISYKGHVRICIRIHSPVQVFANHIQGNAYVFGNCES